MQLFATGMRLESMILNKVSQNKKKDLAQMYYIGLKGKVAKQMIHRISWFLTYRIQKGWEGKNRRQN